MTTHKPGAGSITTSWPQQATRSKRVGLKRGVTDVRILALCGAPLTTGTWTCGATRAPWFQPARASWRRPLDVRSPAINAPQHGTTNCIGTHTSDTSSGKHGGNRALSTCAVATICPSAHPYATMHASMRTHTQRQASQCEKLAHLNAHKNGRQAANRKTWMQYMFPCMETAPEGEGRPPGDCWVTSAGKASAGEFHPPVSHRRTAQQMDSPPPHRTLNLIW